MATDMYSDGSSTYYETRGERAHIADTTVSAYRDPAGTAFLWVAWAAAFAVWAFFMTTFFGIMEAIGRGGAGTLRGGVDMSGAGYLLMDVVGGVIVLGAVLAWGMARWATRDKRRDPITEAATAELYDTAGREGDVAG